MTPLDFIHPEDAAALRQMESIPGYAALVFLFMYSHAHSEIEDYDTDWTVREINFAQKKRKRIVFVNIDGSPLTDWFELMFGTKQQIDASSKVLMEKLCKDLTKWLADKFRRQ